MATLNLTGQATAAGQIQTRLSQMKTALDQRKPIWDRLPLEKKRALIKNGKDPILSQAWQIYRYLRNNFFQEED